MGRQEIIDLITQFISKKDISIGLANRIEAALDEEFPDDEYMQDVIDMLASYRPGGGDYLYDEDAMIKKLKNDCLFSSQPKTRRGRASDA